MAKHPARRGNPPPAVAGSPGGAQESRRVIQSAQWQGPLPPPASLREFDEIIEGGAERILQMAEKEQAHRIHAEQQIVTGEIRANRRGQILGAAIAGLAVVGAIATAWMGAPWPVSVALVSVPVLGIVHTIVNGRRNDRRDRE